MKTFELNPADLTLAKDTIHNPGEARHFMKLKPVDRRVRVLRAGQILAETEDAVRLLELGRDFYDPTLYFQPEDVRARLEKTARSSHCPLKGDAVYFDLVDEDGTVLQPEIAWSYPDPFEFAAGLGRLIAFYGNQVTVEESPK